MKSRLSLLVGTIVLGTIFHYWFFNTRVNLGFDISYAFLPFIDKWPLPWSWLNIQIGDGMGGYSIHTLWVYPSQILYQLLLVFNVPFELQMKYFALLPALLIACRGVYLLAKKFDADVLIACLFYVASTPILMILDGGQLNLAIAYYLLPICFYGFILAVKNSGFYKLVFLGSVFLISYFDIRFVWLLAVICGFWSIYLFVIDKDKKLVLIELLKLIGMCVLGLFLANFYWILPMLFVKPISLSQGFLQLANVATFSFATLEHGLFFQQPHWYLNDFGYVSDIHWYFGLIPLIIAAYFVLNKDTKSDLFWLAVLLIGVFLVKGSNPPFGEVYTWLYSYIPGFQMFRDPSKFFIFVSLGYAILIARFAKYIYSDSISRKFLVITSLSVFLLVISWPVVLQRTTGAFSPYPFEKEYFEISKKFDENSYFRTFWIPTKASLGYVSPQHPSVEAVSFVDKRPFATNIIGGYENYNFLRSEATPGLFDIASIKYIYYPQLDLRRPSTNADSLEYYKWFNQWFKSQRWLNSVASNDAVNIYQLNSVSNHLFGVSSVFWVVGGDDTYQKIAEYSEIKLRDVAVIHLDEFGILFQDIGKFSYLKNYLIFNGVDMLDFQLGFVERKRLVNLKATVKDSDWWNIDKDQFKYIRTFLYEKYGLDFHGFDYEQGYMVSEGESAMAVRLQDSGRLFVRVLESSKSGSMIFQGEGINRGIDTHNDEAILKWHELGEYQKNTEIVINTKGDINMINAMVVLTDEDLSSLSNKVNKYSKQFEIIDIKQIGEVDLKSQTEVSYTQINPTKYKFTVKQAPVVVVLSESYDPYWQLKNNGVVISNSMPVYSLINAFYVDKSGDYEIEYYPQLFVYRGLIVTLVFYVLYISALIYFYNKKK